VLGAYDPRQKDKTAIDAEKVKHWISKGAQVSDTVHNMLISKKIITGKKINVLPLKKPPVKKEETPAAAPAAAPVPEPAK